MWTPAPCDRRKGKTKQMRTRALESRTLYEPCGLGNLRFQRNPTETAFKGHQGCFQGKRHPQIRDLVILGPSAVRPFVDSLDLDRGVASMMPDAPGEFGGPADGDHHGLGGHLAGRQQITDLERS